MDVRGLVRLMAEEVYPVWARAEDRGLWRHSTCSVGISRSRPKRCRCLTSTAARPSGHIRHNLGAGLGATFATSDLLVK